MATTLSTADKTRNRTGGRRLGVALLVIATAQLMVVLDTTVVYVALPHMQTALGFSDSSLEWVVNGYALAFGGLLLLGGRAGDLLGRRRMFVTGLLPGRPRPSPAASPPPRRGCWRPASTGLSWSPPGSRCSWW